MTAVLFWSFWHYYFWPAAGPWWLGAVWGNVIAIVPLFCLTLEHRMAVAAAQRVHSQHLEKIIDWIDPATDGGVSVVHQRLDAICDLLDADTPGGVGTVRTAIEALSSKGDQP